MRDDKPARIGDDLDLSDTATRDLLAAQWGLKPLRPLVKVEPFLSGTADAS